MLKIKFMEIKICYWKPCTSKFSSYMKTRIENDIEHFKLKDVEIEESSCMWQCKKWPNAKVNNEIINFCNWAKLSNAMFKKLEK